MGSVDLSTKVSSYGKPIAVWAYNPYTIPVPANLRYIVGNQSYVATVVGDSTSATVYVAYKKGSNEWH